MNETKVKEYTIPNIQEMLSRNNDRLGQACTSVRIIVSDLVGHEPTDASSVEPNPPDYCSLQAIDRLLTAQANMILDLNSQVTRLHLAVFGSDKAETVGRG